MRRQLPPLNALKTFESAARHLSFLRAAEELSVTPGAVSRQVRALEEWLGIALFKRAHKQVSLTTEGRAYWDDVSPSLESIAAATARISERAQTRPLAIYCYPTFALRWLVPKWRGFYDLHPDIDVQLTTSLRAVDFARDDFDAAIMVGEGLSERSDLVAHKLVDVELIPICSPQLARGRHGLKKPSDLRRHTLLHNAPRPKDWGRWLDEAGVDGVDPSAGPIFDSLNLSIQAALSGVGVAIAIRALIADELAQGQLIQPFGPTRVSSRPFYLVYPRARGDDPRLQHFATWLASHPGPAVTVG